MIRFILKRRVRDNVSGYDETSIHSVDIDVPELEALLSRGGSGENGFDFTALYGVELREPAGDSESA